MANQQTLLLRIKIRKLINFQEINQPKTQIKVKIWASNFKSLNNSRIKENKGKSIKGGTKAEKREPIKIENVEEMIR